MITTFFNKYKKLPKPLKASFWAIVCSVVQKCISFITTPIFTRLLTPEQFGLCNIYDSWYTIIILFTSLNVFQNGFNNAMIKYGERKDEYISSVQCLVAFLAIVFGVFTLLNYKLFYKITSLPVSCLVVLIIELIFVPSYSLWIAKSRFDYDYLPVIVGTLFIGFFSPVAGILLIQMTNNKAEAKIISFAIVQILIGIIAFILNYKKGKKCYDKSMWLYTFKLNIPLIPYYLSSIILSQADRIMINYQCGAKETAFYSLAYTLSLIMTIVSNSINQSLIPFIYKRINSKNISGIDRIVNISCLVVGAINMIIIFIGPELVSFFGTNEYTSAKWVIPPVSISVYFIFLYQMFSLVQLYFGKTKSMASASVLVAVLNIILNYFAINRFGFIAAGYTTLISYMVLTLMYYYVYRKSVNEKGIIGIYNIKYIVNLSLIVLCCLALSLFLYSLDNILRYIALSIVICILFIFKKKIIDGFRFVKS
jgi:O-antigen/teichoic acid export membrane protein